MTAPDSLSTELADLRRDVIELREWQAAVLGNRTYSSILWEDRVMGITKNIFSTTTSLKSLMRVSHQPGNGRRRAS